MLPASWTSGMLRKSTRLNYVDSLNAISLLESGVGVVPLNLPVGTIIDLFGQPLCPVNLGPAEARRKESSMVVTCGRYSPGSLRSVALSASLASRLRERLDSNGSMEYAQIWRRRTTPLGRVFWEHTARLLPIRDNDFSGLPTPTVNSILEKTDPNLAGRVRFLPSGRVRKSSKRGKEGSMNWSQDVLLRGYLPTPQLCLILMGYPITWWECAERAMQSFRRLAQNSSSLRRKQGKARPLPF